MVVAGLKILPLLLLECHHDRVAGIQMIQESKVEGAVSSVTYVFHMGAVANGQKLGALNNTHVFSYSSQGQESKISFTGLKTRCQLGRVPSRGLRGGSLSLTFPGS